MKTRLYYSFMVGTAIAMGNMRGNPDSHNRAAMVTLMDSKSPKPAQAPAADAATHPAPPVNHDASQGDISLIA